MELFNTYQTCCKAALQAIKDIESPYEKAEICTKIMGSIATLLSSPNIEKILENVDSVKKSSKTKKSKAESDIENTTTEPIVDITAENVIAIDDITSENTINESNTQNEDTSIETVQENLVEDNNTESTESVIDKTSDDDDDEWTERMCEKYKEQLEYVQAIYEEYEEKTINDFVEVNSNNLYHSFSDIKEPRQFIMLYSLLKNAIEQQ